MPRKIAFRAWAKEGMYEWEDNHGIISEWLNNAERNVTLMQFTGLTDKNGKEIYEGDVLKTKYIGSPWGVVEYFTGARNNAYAGWLLAYHDESMSIYPHEMEVIGNIYETPNLLSV